MNISSRFLVGVALMVMPAVAQAAQCTFSSEKNFSAEVVAAQIAQYKPTTIGEYLTVINRKILSPADQEMLLATVPRECLKDVARGALEVNGVKASDPISVLNGRPFYLPTRLAAAAPLASMPETVAVAPVAAPVVVPVKDVSPELEAIRAEIAAAKRRLDQAEAKIRGPRAPEEAAMLAPLQAEVKRLERIEARLTNLERSDSLQNGRLNDLEEDMASKANTTDVYIKTEVDGKLAGKPNSTDVYTRKEVDEKLTNNKPSGIPDWLKVLSFVGIPLALFLGGFAFFRKQPDVPAPDLSGLATKEDFDGLKNRVDVTEERLDALETTFVHVVKKIDGVTPKPADMKAMANNIEFTYPLMVDGTLVEVTVVKVDSTRSGDPLVMTVNVPCNKAFGGEKLFAKLADYFEKGGTVPALQAVAA